MALGAKLSHFIMLAVFCTASCTQQDAPVFESSMSIDGIDYETLLSQTTFSCDNFEIEINAVGPTGRASSEEDAQASQIFEAEPSFESPDARAYFIGGNIFQSYAIEYKNKTVTRVISPLESHLNGYDKIDPKQTYSATAQACLPDNSVLFRLWSGGNCETVCEAFASFQFNADGEVLSARGVNYQDYLKLLAQYEVE